MARLTWQNVAAPSFEDALRATASAGQLFTQGFSGLGDVATGFRERAVRDNTADATAKLMQAAAAAGGGQAGRDAVNRILANGELGYKPQDLSSDFGTTVDTMLSNYLDRESTIAGTDQTRAYTDESRNRVSIANQKLPFELTELDLGNKTKAEALALSTALNPLTIAERTRQDALARASYEDDLRRAAIEGRTAFVNADVLGQIADQTAATRVRTGTNNAAADYSAARVRALTGSRLVDQEQITQSTWDRELDLLNKQNTKRLDTEEAVLNKTDPASVIEKLYFDVLSNGGSEQDVLARIRESGNKNLAAAYASYDTSQLAKVFKSSPDAVSAAGQYAQRAGTAIETLLGEQQAKINTSPFGSAYETFTNPDALDEMESRAAINDKFEPSEDDPSEYKKIWNSRGGVSDYVNDMIRKYGTSVGYENIANLIMNYSEGSGIGLLQLQEAVAKGEIEQRLIAMAKDFEYGTTASEVEGIKIKIGDIKAKQESLTRARDALARAIDTGDQKKIDAARTRITEIEDSLGMNPDRTGQAPYAPVSPVQLVDPAAARFEQALRDAATSTPPMPADAQAPAVMVGPTVAAARGTNNTSGREAPADTTSPQLSMENVNFDQWNNMSTAERRAAGLPETALGFQNQEFVNDPVNWARRQIGMAPVSPNNAPAQRTIENPPSWFTNSTTPATTLADVPPQWAAARPSSNKQAVIDAWNRLSRREKSRVIKEERAALLNAQ
jgi:hypothetical protein